MARTVVDPADYASMRDVRWYRTDVGYAHNKRVGYMHRLIAGLMGGDPRVVDHINGDVLDNRRANLRVCTRGQNLQNRHARARRGSMASEYRGVCRAGDRWEASCQAYGVRYRVLCDTETDAAEVARALREAHMPFSTT